MSKRDKLIILFDGERLDFRQSKITEVVSLHNRGYHYKQIAKKMGLKQINVLLILLHEAYEGKEYLRQIGMLFAGIDDEDEQNGSEAISIAVPNEIQKGMGRGD